MTGKNRHCYLCSWALLVIAVNFLAVEKWLTDGQSLGKPLNKQRNLKIQFNG